MLSRFRWYRVNFPNRDFNLEKVISNKPLTLDSNFGFSRIADDLDVPRFRFLWRTKVVVTHYDDEGMPTYEKIASINFIDFAIVSFDDEKFLRLENPGRCLSELFNTIELIVGLGFTSKLITFDKVRPTTIFEKVEVTKLIGLKVAGAVLDQDLVGRMEFSSSQGMIIDNIKILDGVRYKIDSSVYELLYEGIRGQLAVSANGTVKLSGQLAPRLLRFIEFDLPKLV